MIVIVGALIVLASVIGGFMMGGGHVGSLLQVAEFAIICGSALGASTREFSFRNALRFEFTPELNAQLNESNDDRRYTVVTTDRIAGAGTNGRRDDFFVTDFTVTYLITQKLAVSGTYLFRTNASNRSYADFYNNVVSFTASIRY